MDLRRCAEGYAEVRCNRNQEADCTSTAELLVSFTRSFGGARSELTRRESPTAQREVG